jgi:uncharacterized protein YcbK (DUF882 family)
MDGRDLAPVFPGPERTSMQVTKKIEMAIRRRWISSALLCLVAPLIGSAQSSGVANQQTLEHRLRLFHTHTGERIDIIYRRGDTYLTEAIAKLDFFLRDFRTGDVRHFDPRLYDTLEDLTISVGRPGVEIDIICGYRSPWTNEFLRSHTTGVAKNSLHIQAEAIDLRIPGVNTLKLRQAALGLRRGGVGYYPHSDFIHVDTGRVRQWCFDCPPSLLTGD